MEVLVVLLIVSSFVLLGLFALPRQRETARTVGCRRNLMQVGVALVLFDRDQGHLPTIPILGAEPKPTGGPLKALLETLTLPDLTELSAVSSPPKPRPGRAPTERAVPGFVCPSDPYALTGSSFRAPVSYRASTGDATLGVNGGFAPGRRVTLREIEDGDGLGFTAAFSERLLGRPGTDRGMRAYQSVRGPLDGAACPASSAGDWRRDAGSSWAEASWRSTLYNHALTPNAPRSCVTTDGSAAFLGASSAHSGGIHVLLFDGGVRLVGPTIAPPVWRALATTHAAPSLQESR